MKHFHAVLFETEYEHSSATNIILSARTRSTSLGDFGSDEVAARRLEVFSKTLTSPAMAGGAGHIDGRRNRGKPVQVVSVGSEAPQKFTNVYREGDTFNTPTDASIALGCNPAYVYQRLRAAKLAGNSEVVVHGVTLSYLDDMVRGL